MNSQLKRVLLVIGSPLWLPLLVAAVAIVLSLYVVLWAVIVSLWAVFASLIGVAISGVVGGAGFAIGSSMPSGVAMFGAGLVCAGAAVFLFFLCKGTTRGIVLLTKKIVLGIRRRRVKREVAE